MILVSLVHLLHSLTRLIIVTPYYQYLVPPEKLGSQPLEVTWKMSNDSFLRSRRQNKVQHNFFQRADGKFVYIKKDLKTTGNGKVNTLVNESLKRNRCSCKSEDWWCLIGLFKLISSSIFEFEMHLRYFKMSSCAVCELLPSLTHSYFTHCLYLFLKLSESIAVYSTPSIHIHICIWI